MNSKSKLLFYIKGQVVPRLLTYTYITSCRKLTCCPSRKLLTGCSAQEQGYTNQRAKFVTQSAQCLIQRAKLMQSVNWFVQNAKLLGQNGKFRTEDIMPPAQIVLQARFYSSSVFVSDRHSDSSSSFQFDHDLEEKLSDIEKLKTNLQRRGLHIDVEQLRRDYLEYVELHKEKFRLETEREDIARQIAVIVAQQKESKTKSKEQISQMKKLVEKGKNAKTRQKELMGKYWDVEEKVMISALSLPSNLSQDVPEKLVVLQECFEDRKPAVPVDHDEVLRKSQMVRLSNVGHSAYYLTGRLAVLEQELVNHFSAHLRSKNITQMLAPEMFKTPVVEAGCIDVMDPASVYRLQYKHGTKQITDWDSDHMFLQGASQLSFLSYFAKMLISSEDLPVKLFVVGRNYIPENSETSSLPGLYGVLQSIQVCLCGVCSTRESCGQVMEQFTDILTDIYKQFELPFRLVSLPACSLTAAEENRIELQIWVPSLQQYLKVASVSMCGDYSSRRLMIRCSHSTRKSSSNPVYMVHCEVTDVTRMIALLLEYGLADNTWER
ncbi:serine--tRNA synthetase-like protein Slimp isoform X2 [Mercenaria mercenaria]|nr:serine--tRNA synthetase-like protein Slimp isoform X2 [Mercenaria mercenaria]XP_045172184.2 serine--tRNA synthetase-like protein Slimp isoform X2 [Mercenaria mercenaria]XP_045172185.2 serine--tRNA synthetase-like protein Slimp isoform X2 [Mercenaria mercenaria]